MELKHPEHKIWNDRNGTIHGFITNEALKRSFGSYEHFAEFIKNTVFKILNQGLGEKHGS